MFISTLELFKIGIGPSSSHTLGPMIAAKAFIDQLKQKKLTECINGNAVLRCTLKGSLAFTGKGHSTDRAIVLGVHGHEPAQLATQDVEQRVNQLWCTDKIQIDDVGSLGFNPETHIVFDKGEPLPEHPNGMVFEVLGPDNEIVFSETYFSLGGGFISTLDEIRNLKAPVKINTSGSYPYPFDSAAAMLQMASDHEHSIADMKRKNEGKNLSDETLNKGMDAIWQSMTQCIKTGLSTDGILPGGLEIKRRAKDLYQQISSNSDNVTINDWLCAYAMAVNEENAAGHMVVTAPT
ncbi:MAG: L-serine ammonia-lyase, iron-sulfur-dependent, subunit alpha, partial [Gammaproteobacteria bacterium]|nr:L-serine ammonia-lyase, iron-sulfur-dependent, subunit alpha [Gammaproteobacteria bacterium]